MVKHVPTVAILLVIQGALEVCAGLFASLYALVYGALAFVPWSEQVEADPNQLPAETLSAILGGAGLVFLLIAFGITALGSLKIVAGIFNFRYRKRTLGLVALMSAFGSLLTCYCGPTGIALAAYGLFVYLDRAVTKAFDLGEQGLSSDDILRSFLDRTRPTA
jgi:hypothetical protein